MTLRFLDSFDHYTDLTQKGWVLTGASTPSIASTYVRTGDQALRLRNISSLGTMLGHGCNIALPAATYVTVGLAFYFPQELRGMDSVYQRTLIAFLYNGAAQLRVCWDKRCGTLAVARSALSNPTSLSFSAGGLLAPNRWHYIEAKARLHGSEGFCEVRVDEATVLRLENVNTKYHAAATVINGIALSGGCSSSEYVYVDDLYILDDAGTINNDFLGNIRVESLTPTADGALNAWTPSAGSDHWPLIDEVPPDMADYVATDTPGAIDTYHLTDLITSSVGIHGVQHLFYAREADAAGRILRPVVRQGGANHFGDGQALTTTEAYARAISETNPATGLAWTEDDVNAHAEFGMERQ